MQIKSPTHKINAQLEKLNKLMQEQFQFNQKYILKALQSTGSNNSQYDQDGRSQNDQTIFEQHRLSKITNRNVLPYQFFASENNNYAQLEIQYQEKAFPTAIQKNQAKCWQENNKIQKFIPFQAQLDQQLTTKSISYLYEGQTKLQLNSLFHQDTLEDEDRLTVLKVCTRNNEKQNLNTQNKVIKKEKEKSSNISDSAISTTQIFEGSFHKKIQRKRKQEYKPFNQSIKVKNSTKKILIKNIDNNKQLQKQKRPITSTKVPNNLQKQEKFQLNKLKKLKQDSIQSKQKKLTNRNTKTQRQKLQIEVGTKLLKNPSRCNLQQNKKRGNNFSKKSKIQKRIIKHQPFTVVSNLNKFSQKNKTWQKSAQKTVKKLNKVNLTKLNDNLKQQAKKVDIPLGSNHKNQYLNNKISENKMINIYKNLTNTKGQIRYGNDLNANIEKQKQENNLKFKQDKNIVEKLDFNSKIPIMQRMIQRKKIFKYYTLMANNYIESSQKLNTKYFKQLQLQIKEMQDKGLYIFKIIKAIAVFFSQFFRPTKKNVMGMIAKCTQDQQILNLWENANFNRGNLIQKQILMKKQADFRKTKFSNFNISKTLILALLDKPKDLVNNILTLPSYLYDCNILSQNSLKNLLNQNDNINQTIDQDGDLQLFLLKKTKIFIYFHELVQFIKFLKQYDLIQQTERRNLNIQKNMMAGYYSSRNRRKERNKSNKFNNKHIKGCDSQRKNTIQGLQTQRILINQDMLNNLSRIKTKKQLKQQKQQKISLQKQTHMFKSRENKIQCI